MRDLAVAEALCLFAVQSSRAHRPEQVIEAAFDAVDELGVLASAVFLRDDGRLQLCEYRGGSEDQWLQAGLCADDVDYESGKAVEIGRSDNDMKMVLFPLLTCGQNAGAFVCMVGDGDDSAIDAIWVVSDRVSAALAREEIHSQCLHMERQLAVVDRKYRLLLEHAHDAIWVTDLHNRIVAANDACANMLNRDVDDLLMVNADDIFIPADDQQTTGRLYDRHVVGKDGSHLMLKVATSSVVIGDKTVGYQHIGRDVTQERRIHENLRFYVQQITNAQEEERRRIARELHDSTAQSLIALLHQIENYLEGKRGLPMSDSRFLWSITEQLKSALHEVRQFSRDLRPSILDDLGLLPAVEWLAEELGRHHDIDGQVEVVGKPRRFSPEVELTLFRIVQEGLRNIVRHANASRAQVMMVFSDYESQVKIVDNGNGMKVPMLDDLPRAGKLGLAGMRERAQLLQGWMKIESTAGRGTTITIMIPHDFE